MDRLSVPDEPIEGGLRRGEIGVKEVKMQAMTMYWRLKKYEDTGLTPGQIIEIDRLYTEMCREVQRYRWIPVEERLPEAGQEVIVTCKSESGYYVTHDEYDWDYCAWVSDSDDIVAWMPLPEPFNI